MQEIGIGNASRYMDSKVTRFRNKDVINGCKMGYPLRSTDNFIDKILSAG